MRKNNRRFIYMFLVALLIAYLLGHLIPPIPTVIHNKLYDYLLTIFITFLVWEGNLRIDHWLNKKIPWITNPGFRLFVQFMVSSVYSAAGVYLPMKVFNTFVCIIPPEREMLLNVVSLSLGLIVSIIILTIEISSQFFRNWKESLVQIEQYKVENMRAQLQNLKNQINPHFLFNNMSVLSSLVYKDQDKAVDFINQLSKVYRYLLDNHANELVELRTELNFVHSYIFLLQIRFDKNIKFEIDVPEPLQSSSLPPMSLQMLIENAIKHNVVSEESPLSIKIDVHENYLRVANDIHLRTVTEDSSKTGLKNIKDRYRFFSKEEVQIHETATKFIVKLPLLKLI